MKTICLIFLLAVSFRLPAQSLLLNGGFEEENICTEYQVNCAPEAWLANDDGFFNYFKDVNRSHTDLHCMAIEAGHSKKAYKRTFIRSRLLCGLHRGNQYRIEFFVKSPHPVLDSVGVYFTSYDILFDKTPLQKIKPSFYLADAGVVFKKDSSWQQVSFIYTANGSESFITVGNFSRNDVTGNTGIQLENNFFVFIDDISMTPLNVNEKLCNDWQLSKKTIYDQDERHEYLRRLLKEKSPGAKDAVKLTKDKLVRVDTLILPDILFETGKSGLKSDSYSLLDSICNRIKNSHVDSVVVEGHTDNTGSFEINEKLSVERAVSVKNYLQHKTGYSYIIPRGKSYSLPKAENDTPEGRQKNRRVEILCYISE